MAGSGEDFFQKGLKHFQAGNADAAEKALQKAVRMQPNHGAAHGALGAVLMSRQKYMDAANALRTALKFNPQSTASLYNYGLALKAIGQPERALECFDKLIANSATDFEALNNRGTVQNDLKNFDAAIADFDRALSIKPGYVAALCNKGKSLSHIERYDEALAIYRLVLQHDPTLLEAWLGIGFVLHKKKHHEEAAEAYLQISQLKPDYPFLKGILLHQKMLACDWDGIAELIEEIEQDILNGELSAEPFGWQGVARSSRSLQLCAEIYNKAKFPSQDARYSSRPRPSEKIRVGYVSGEFREQATSILMVGVLEKHDRSRFEIHAFDNGWNDGSGIRKRIDNAVVSTIDIRSLTDPAAADAIAARQIDILVNLNGYFGEDRTAVFAMRPAPVQVNYLGYPGTMGAPYMDYIIADRTVLPEEDWPFYDEKVVHLPNCYQANDARREVPDRDFTRQSFGLPESGFVFCCFNNNYKITPDIFDRWMRILHRVPDSVLWLIEDNITVRANLLKEAGARGIESQRIIFSVRISPSDHLARHRLADLFLDTLPYNAHTTGSDALWTGLPIITCAGSTFAGRVAKSLLDNIGLPELVAATLNDYEDLAVRYATEAGALAALKQKLAGNRLASPLFDTEAFTRDLERAYAAMHERHRSGKKPAPIVLTSP